jgi:hypothetical protein
MHCIFLIFHHGPAWSKGKQLEIATLLLYFKENSDLEREVELPDKIQDTQLNLNPMQYLSHTYTN